MTIMDTGDRTRFASGAVRDMHEGKGRCDLMPLAEIGTIINLYANTDWKLFEVTERIGTYVESGNVDCLRKAFWEFATSAFGDIWTALIELSKHYEEGCQKYGERNWESGIPVHSFVDSAARHYFRYRRGDTDERHDRAVLWNLLGAIWTHQHYREMIDLPFMQTEGNNADH